MTRITAVFVLLRRNTHAPLKELPPSSGASIGRVGVLDDHGVILRQTSVRHGTKTRAAPLTQSPRKQAITGAQTHAYTRGRRGAKTQKTRALFPFAHLQRAAKREDVRGHTHHPRDSRRSQDHNDAQKPRVPQRDKTTIERPTRVTRPYASFASPKRAEEATRGERHEVRGDLASAEPLHQYAVETITNPPNYHENQISCDLVAQQLYRCLLLLLPTCTRAWWRRKFSARSTS